MLCLGIFKMVNKLHIIDNYELYITLSNFTHYIE